jgi:hypothetical protein
MGFNPSPVPFSPEVFFSCSRIHFFIAAFEGQKKRGIARTNHLICDQKLKSQTFYVQIYKPLNIFTFLTNISCFFHAEDYEYGKSPSEVTRVD